MDHQLLHNALGTAYNVLLEQDHPDLDNLGVLLRENLQHLTDKGIRINSQFDLRHRRFDGTKL